MNTKSIVELIASIMNLKQLDYQPDKIVTHLASNRPGCNLCSILNQNMTQLASHASTTTDRYNKLLKQVQKLIDMYYELFEQQQLRFQQTALELEKENKQCQQKIKDLEQTIEQNTKTILQYRNLLFQKDQILAEYEEKHQKYFKQKNLGSPNQQNQILKFHKKQKSQLCHRLQNLNLDLLSDNKKYKQQNKQLVEHVNQLNQYIKRMEEDLANHNIRSPKIILNQFTQLGEFSNGFDRTLEQVDKISAQLNNHQLSSQFQIQDSIQQRNSLTSSFAPNGRRPLRDILNISGQTINYFNLRTKQKIQSSNADILGHNISNQNIENMNTVNLQKKQKSSSLDKIMEIKQFQIHEPKIDRIKQQQKNNKKSNNKNVLSIQIDPYYAFFSLTIQCLKLNWRSLDQVANIQLNDEWDNILAKQIPINRWNDYLKQLMIKRLKSSE